MDVTQTLINLRIDPTMNIHRAIYEIGMRVNEAPSRLKESNKIIQALGGPRIMREDRVAEIIAKALIEQALLNRFHFDIDKAMEEARKKYARIFALYPYAVKSTEGDQIEERPAKQTRAKKDPKPKKPKDPRVDEKKNLALKLCEENSNLPDLELGKLIANQMKISYSNARYYVTRVWKRK